MLTDELESVLNNSFIRARAQRHEYLTVEHLLLAVMESPKVQEILSACGADLKILTAELTEHINESTPQLEETEHRDVQPTLGFQRVLQLLPSCW
jgi:ATP-dependent Clp protease ATP-binding subunit ClpA